MPFLPRLTGLPTLRLSWVRHHEELKNAKVIPVVLQRLLPRFCHQRSAPSIASLSSILPLA